MEELKLLWTEYFRYRANLRGFRLERVEEIVRYSTERYFDSETNRCIAVGIHDSELVLIPYEIETDSATPVTIHVTTRQQISSAKRFYWK